MSAETYTGPDRRNHEDLKRMMENIAEKAAKQKVEQILDNIGIDMDNHLEMREDFSWMRRWRQMSEKVGSRVLMTLFTIVTVGVAGLIWSQISGNK